MFKFGKVTKGLVLAACRELADENGEFDAVEISTADVFHTFVNEGDNVVSLNIVYEDLFYEAEDRITELEEDGAIELVNSDDTVYRLIQKEHRDDHTHSPFVDCNTR